MLAAIIRNCVIIFVLIISPNITLADVAADFDSAQQAMKQGRFAQANFFYFKILNSQPNNIEAQYGLALCFVKQRDYERARAELDKLLLLNSGHTDGLLLSATVNLQFKNWSSALMDAERVIQNSPDNINAYIYLSNAYAGMGDETSAKKAMEYSTQLANAQK